MTENTPNVPEELSVVKRVTNPETWTKEDQAAFNLTVVKNFLAMLSLVEDHSKCFEDIINFVDEIIEALDKSAPQEPTA